MKQQQKIATSYKISGRYKEYQQQLQPPLPQGSHQQEIDILNKMYKIRNIVKTTKFRRLCMLNNNQISQSPYWSHLQTQLNQLASTITTNNPHEYKQIANQALVLAMNCFYNCITSFINNHRKYLNINNNHNTPLVS